MKSIKLIIFDVYGVLLNGGYPDTSRAISNKYGGNWRKIYKVLYGDFNKAATREISQKEAWQKSIDFFKLPLSVEQIKSIHYGLMSPNKPVFKLADKLKRNHKILLLSKNTREQFSYLIEHEPIIKKTFRKNVINTWEYKLPKASKKTMELICKKFGVSPDEIAYVDDQNDNLEEAKEMGVNTILYKNFRQFEKDLGKLIIA